MSDDPVMHLIWSMETEVPKKFLPHLKELREEVDKDRRCRGNKYPVLEGDVEEVYEDYATLVSTEAEMETEEHLDECVRFTNERGVEHVGTATEYFLRKEPPATCASAWSTGGEDEMRKPKLLTRDPACESYAVDLGVYLTLLEANEDGPPTEVTASANGWVTIRLMVGDCDVENKRTSKCHTNKMWAQRIAQFICKGLGRNVSDYYTRSRDHAPFDELMTADPEDEQR